MKDVKAGLKTRLTVAYFISSSFFCEMKGKMVKIHLNRRHFSLCGQLNLSASNCIEKKGREVTGTVKYGQKKDKILQKSYENKSDAFETKVYYTVKVFVL